jgi:Asp-tRNA(Asn)/Glu-tRNA(Gln) amidotransferase A subunit family amidase
MGTHLSESTLLRVAHAIEVTSGFEPVPPLVKGLGA